MKNTSLLRLGIFLSILFVSSGLYAQTTTFEQRLIGTWVLQKSSIAGIQGYVLTVDLNGTYAGNNNNKLESGKWAVSNDIKLVFIQDDGPFNGIIYDAFITPDGKTLLYYSGSRYYIFQKK